VYWNTILRRGPDGQFRFAYDGDVTETASTEAGAGDETEDLTGAARTWIFHRLGRATDRTACEVESEFHTKLRYVRYLRRTGVDDFDSLYEFLADLRADEAATVERARLDAPGPARATDGGRADDAAGADSSSGTWSDVPDRREDRGP
jgi:hypothetical protein